MNKNRHDKKTRLLQTVFFLMLISLIFYVLFFLTGVHTICYTRAFTGIPCPGCGMTRAWKAVFRLDFATAFFYHPLFILPLIVVILLFMQFQLNIKIPAWIWHVMLILFISVYICRMFFLFPDKEPMTYNQDAYLPRIYHYFITHLP